MPHADDLSPASWNAQYATGDTPWDLGTVSPPFVEYLQRHRPKPGRLAVPGAGPGHEALFFARHGFDVTAFDFAPEACATLKKRAVDAGVPLQVECTDALALPVGLDGTFDYVLEQTFFCAIHPSRRPDYVKTVHRLLKPHGLLFGVFYAIDRRDGPPFGTDANELRALFASHFSVATLERCTTSHPRRAGRELWAQLVRKDAADAPAPLR